MNNLATKSNTALPVFLTAFDPAELPGGSLDPLGFTGGYLALADQLFPGMTAAASQATYLPMLCAALYVAEQHLSPAERSAQSARKRRIDLALRFERYWALACALHVGSAGSQDTDATEDASEDSWGPLRVPGLRGIRYVVRHLQRLKASNASTTDAEFPLLAAQFRYGAFGIYAGVGEGLGLFGKSTFALSTDFGEAIGRGFLEATLDTAQRKELLRAIADPKATVGVKTLQQWGASAFVGLPVQGELADLLRQALLQDPQRARMLRTLDAVQRAADGPLADWDALGECRRRAEADADPSLYRLLDAVHAYDAFLRSFTLVFERALWLCHATAGTVPAATVIDDAVVQNACATLPALAANCAAVCAELPTAAKLQFVSRGRGVHLLAQQVANLAGNRAIVDAVITRHEKIQRAKVEQGRPKQAWVAAQGAHSFALTSSQAGERSMELTTPEEVRGPDWRVRAGSNLLKLVGGVCVGEAQ